MRTPHLNPYRAPEEVAGTVDRLHKGVSPVVHPQHVLQRMRTEKSPCPLQRLAGRPHRRHRRHNDVLLHSLPATGSLGYMAEREPAR
jgi:hypothetical protein